MKATARGGHIDRCAAYGKEPVKVPHGAKGKGKHPWKEGKKGRWRKDPGPVPQPHETPVRIIPTRGGDFPTPGSFPSPTHAALAAAFADGDLVGSANEITDFDGTVTASAGGTGANPLAGNKLRALAELTKPTRRIGRKKSERGPSRSRVY